MDMPQPSLSTLRVDLGARSYDIEIGSSLLAQAGKQIASLLQTPRTVIVTDSNVAPLYLDALSRTLEAENIACEAVTLPAGEATKSFPNFEALCESLLGLGVERKTTLIALGGGVIGDITGFAASVLLRGMEFIQIPTTLLAQVDSSVGGKTGINTKQGKNLVGSFHQPCLVLADMDTLNSLPKRELLAGYAEVVKYGLINDPGFFAWLEKGNGAAIIDGDAEARAQAVRTSCQAKAAIVAEDEKEKGARALLNLGHTFGHALEAESGYGETLLHGEAVAIGTIMAFVLSVRIGLCPAQDLQRVLKHFEAVGLPTNLDNLQTSDWTEAKLLAHMGKDKKVADGKITFVLTKGIGRSFLTNEVAETDLMKTLESFL